MALGGGAAARNAAARAALVRLAHPYDSAIPEGARDAVLLCTVGAEEKGALGEWPAGSSVALLKGAKRAWAAPEVGAADEAGLAAWCVVFLLGCLRADARPSFFFMFLAMSRFSRPAWKKSPQACKDGRGVGRRRGAVELPNGEK